MPIIVGNKPIFRIKYKDADIREVYKGDTLKWGFYFINYINKGPKDVQAGWGAQNNILNYVWGYPNQSEEDFYLYVPDNITATEAESLLGKDYGYKSHADGWFDNHQCINDEEKELFYIPAITRDFHRDLTLFCKWRQRRYVFSGIYRYEVDEGNWKWVED